MIKRQIGLLLAACLLSGSAVVTAQQAKTSMTNADVIEMVKAGLPESTVVLAIQRSQTDFDTSPQTLIQLKKQGVSQKILEAMLQPQAGMASTSPRNPDLNNQFPGQPELGDPAGTSLTEVALIDGAKRIAMKRSEPNSRGSTGGMIMNPFGKVKVKAALNGNHAQLRITNTSPVFEVGLPSDVNAADQLVLIKLNPKSDRREVEIGRAGITGSSVGFRKEAIVATTFEEVKPLTVGGGLKYTLYRVKVVSPLPPGEYAFAPRSLYYDFGVDPGQ
jgi:hypothetical protein